MSLVTEYIKLQHEFNQKYGDNSVIFMMVGSFYEIYGYPGASKEPQNTWSLFSNANSKHFLESVDYPNYDVAIFEFSSFGAPCCGYLHLFNTKNEFQYLGKFDAFF